MRVTYVFEFVVGAVIDHRGDAGKIVELAEPLVAPRAIGRKRVPSFPFLPGLHQRIGFGAGKVQEPDRSNGRLYVEVASGFQHEDPATAQVARRRSKAMGTCSTPLGARLAL